MKNDFKQDKQNCYYFSKKTIDEIREIDLLSYLKTFEPQELVRCGPNVYCLREHDSLKLSNGKWFWWSKGIGGVSALDFLIKVRGIPFTKAVRILCEQQGKVPPFSLQKPMEKKKELKLPDYNYDCKIVRKYLEKRGIDDEIIDYFINKKMIGEDNRNGYAFFFGDDECGKHRQCSIRATDGTMFKHDASGSDKHFSFHLFSSESESLRVFESAIDLMSFATLLKYVNKDLKRENLMSLSGVYLPNIDTGKARVPVVLQKFLEKNTKIKTIYLYFDADKTGMRAALGLVESLKDAYEVRYVPPERGKDFNDYLLLQKQKSEKTMEKER